MTRRSVLAVLSILLLGGLTMPAGATAPGPTGEIFFSRDTDGNGGTPNAVYGVDLNGTERIVDAVAAGSGGPYVSPDGGTLAFVGEDGAILLQSIVGGPVVTLLPAGTVAFIHLAWSPDGSQMIFVSGPASESAVTVINVADGSTTRTLTSRLGGSDEIVWSSDGFVYQAPGFGDGGGIRRLDPVGDVLLDIAIPGFTSDNKGIDASPDGTRLATSCNQSGTEAYGICIVDTSGALQGFISPSTNARDRNPRFSPDGGRIAFGDSKLDFTGHDLVSTTLDGGDPLALAPDTLPTSWGRVPETTPMPLEEPPPPPTNEALACGGFDDDPGSTERADFADPVLYAVAVSQARFGCGGDRPADHVVLSRDDAFADSLVGAALTGGGPLLFTQTGSLPAATRTEIDRVLDAGDTVYLLGGTVAVSQAVGDELSETYTVARLSGPSRVETSVAVAREVLSRGADGAILAVARAGGPEGNPTAGWADSVSGGAWTAANAVPTVVTDTGSLHPAVQAFIDDNAFTRTVLFGGEGALSSEIADGVPGAQRVAGASRAGTAQAIAVDLLGIGSGDEDRRIIAVNGFRADGWLFGLPAAGLAADQGAAIALAQSPVPPETLALACSPADVDVLLAGGLGQLTGAAAEELGNAPSC